VGANCHPPCGTDLMMTAKTQLCKYRMNA